VGQKTHPIGLRLGIIRGWESNWYGGKNFTDKLIEDIKIRDYIEHRIQNGGISKIVIERTLKRIIITIHTSKPGIIIGKGGSEVDKLKEEIKKITNKDVQINIYEIKRPELDAKLVAQNICQQIEGRVSFRRAMKSAIQSTMKMGAKGIKVICSGRLGGVEMARSEMYKEGQIPLQTLRADIDYSMQEALTIYGKIGVKVWIFRGMIYHKPDLSADISMAGASATSLNNINSKSNENKFRNNKGNDSVGKRNKKKKK
jgi:small subunit ribosomal protein S3